MKQLEGTNKVPVIYTAHHASHDFHDFSQRLALTEEQQIRFSDYGTDVTVPQNGIVALVAEHSRALGDLNRAPDDPGRFQLQDYAQPARHNIWQTGKELQEHEKWRCMDGYWWPFHNEIKRYLVKQKGSVFVVAWDNTAHYKIGHDDHGKSAEMKPIILSNRGVEGSGKPGTEPVSCDPIVLETLATNLKQELAARGLPDDVRMNYGFKGGYICRQYSSHRTWEQLQASGIRVKVQSFQVEYDTLLTHDQGTLEPNQEAIEKLRLAVEAAIEQTCTALEITG